MGRDDIKTLKPSCLFFPPTFRTLHTVHSAPFLPQNFPNVCIQVSPAQPYTNNKGEQKKSLKHPLSLVNSMDVVLRPANPTKPNKGPEQARKTKNQVKNARRRQKKKEKQKQAGDDGHDTSVGGTPNKPVVSKQAPLTTDKPASIDKPTNASDKGGGIGRSSASERRLKGNATQLSDVPTDDDVMPKTADHITESKLVISDESDVKDAPEVEKKPAATENVPVIENVPSTEDESATENEPPAPKDEADSDDDESTTAKKEPCPSSSPTLLARKAESDTSSDASGDTSDTPGNTQWRPSHGQSPHDQVWAPSSPSSLSAGEDLRTLKKAAWDALAQATRAVSSLGETQEQMAGARRELEGTQNQLVRFQYELDDSGEAMREMEEVMRELCERLLHVLQV